MLATKSRDFKQHSSICLENLVPADNFYRRLEAKVDLSFVRGLVQDCYAKRVGRPSIDPLVFFKLQLIMFFEGLRSERQLMQLVAVNLAHRWYIGYDLDQPVPHHSSLTRIRQRYGVAVFQRFFEHIVELCIHAKLVWGKELFFDGTRVEANADMDSLTPRFRFQATQHLQSLFPQAEPRGFIEKYGKGRFIGPLGTHYERVTDSLVSRTDPDATPMRRAGDERASLGYHLHYVVDGGKARIILAALVTPSSVTDNAPMLDLAFWTRFRWHLHPAIAVGDSKYGSAENVLALQQQGIRPYIPIPDPTLKSRFYPASRFTYVADGDYYICPAGERLSYHHTNTKRQQVLYKAKALTCYHCAQRPQCTPSRSGRGVRRDLAPHPLEPIRAYKHLPAFQKALRKRSVWVEPLFGEAKQFHGLRRFRLRRLWRVNIEGLLVAAGQNIKRLLHASISSLPPAQAIAVALPLLHRRAS